MRSIRFLGRGVFHRRGRRQQEPTGDGMGDRAGACIESLGAGAVLSGRRCANNEQQKGRGRDSKTHRGDLRHLPCQSRGKARQEERWSARQRQLRKLALERAAVHAEEAGSLRDVSVAVGQHALDVLPLDASE